ncbi:hypothetical protein WR25_19024 isoform D [Diploscapter pachys]|uniref:MYND-type domain-containing protein n=1 Tax=Diploscapter pachys TaxID=2018661 RepID=A0A2A2KG85_9BILA|nr:hypothetical protein WR25_19024 isoform D [Diploscapter pachys]
MTPSTDNIPKKEDEIASIHSRIKIFEHPFATQVINPKADQFCSHCMRAPVQGEKLLKCSGFVQSSCRSLLFLTFRCNFVRYCSKDCQRLGWKIHRPECRRLKASFPNLPLTEVLFLSKIIDRLIFIDLNGDKYNWQSERPWPSLVDHKEDIRYQIISFHFSKAIFRKDENKMEHFEKVYKKMEIFRKEEMIDKEKFFDIFCKTTINSHSIHTNAGTEVGMALDLGISKYNHSCRPTCSMVFDGYRVCLRPLVPGVDASDVTQAFISYIDVGRSKFVRRRDLQIRWYFHCECTRCSDKEDDYLTAIKCSNPACDEPLMTSETEEPCYIQCPKCKTVIEEGKVKEAQELMRSLPAAFDPQCPAEVISDKLRQAEEVLHPTNVYVSRLRTALFHVTGTLTMSNLTSMHKEIYTNYKRCFPRADRHVGYQLLHIIKSLIEKGDREEAISYAFDAMNVFEVCFGLDHPYYLQTLALWTFLDQKVIFMKMIYKKG